MTARPLPGVFFAVAAILLVVAVAGPVVAVLLSVTPAEVVATFASGPASEAVRVSLLAAFAATAAATVLGVPGGYWISRVSPRLSTPLLFVVALPLAFPPIASGIILLSALRSTPLPDTLLGVAAAEFFVAGSFVAVSSAAAFSAQDPLYGDAARTLGVSEWRIFRSIALPAAAGNVGAGIAFTWLRAIGEYGATSIVAYHPTSLPVALYVALSASGVRSALALTYGFIVMAAAVLGVAWVLRARVVE